MGIVSHRANNNALVSNAVALMAATVGSAGLGMAFWVIAAHMFDQATVGRASAEVAAVTLVAGLGQLSIVSIFARFLPIARGRTMKIIQGGYGTTLAASFVVAVGFILFGFGADFLDRGFVPIVLFVASVLLYGIFALQDVVLTALHRARWVLSENIAVAAIRLAALPLLFIAGWRAVVFGAWALPMIAAVAVVSWLLFRKVVPAKVRLGDDRGLLPTRSELVNYSIAQYVSGIISTIGGLLPPVLVVSEVGPTAGAAFYLPWLFCTASIALLWNIVFSLVVEAVHNIDRTRQLLTRAAWLGALVTCGGGAVLGFGAPWILGVVGSGYRAEGTIVLRLLALSLPFIGIGSLYGALSLIEKRTWMSTALGGVGVAIFLGGGVASASHYGLAGFGLSFLISRVVVALGAMPGIVIQYRRLAVPDATMVLAVDHAFAAMSTETQVLYPIYLARGVARVRTPEAGRTIEYRRMSRRDFDDDRTKVLAATRDRAEPHVAAEARTEVLTAVDRNHQAATADDRTTVLRIPTLRPGVPAAANGHTGADAPADNPASADGHAGVGTSADGGTGPPPSRHRRRAVKSEEVPASSDTVDDQATPALADLGTASASTDRVNR